MFMLIHYSICNYVWNYFLPEEDNELLKIHSLSLRHRTIEMNIWIALLRMLFCRLWSMHLKQFFTLTIQCTYNWMHLL